MTKVVGNTSASIGCEELESWAYGPPYSTFLEAFFTLAFSAFIELH